MVVKRLGKAASACARMTCVAGGLLLAWTACASTAYATPMIPEIDPGSMSSALTLLMGGLLVLAGRHRRK